MTKKVKQEVKEVAGTGTVKTLAIPNYSIALLYRLLNVPLHGQQSRSRNRFGQMLKDRVQYIEGERIKMLEAVAKVDKETGKAAVKVEDGEERYVIDPKPMAKYEKDFEAFMHESFVIDLLPSIKPDIISIRPLILESKVPMETPDGYVYEELCKAFESI